MPYRIDISSPPPRALDVLVDLGALDVESTEHGMAAIMPDVMTHEMVSHALRGAGVTVSPAVGRDNNSVWLLRAPAAFKGVALTDSDAFGTGHHPTTALCLEVLEEILTSEVIDGVLDVGTGSGILALAALRMGVAQATGLDTDADALRVADENARLNKCAGRLQLVLGGPDAVTGNWPLVVANVLAAPLTDMAPTLVRRVASHGRLILSGIPKSLEPEVKQAYQHLGMVYMESRTRAGWTMLMLRASW